MYESGMGAMIDAALRLEEFLDVPIVQPLDPFEYKRDDTAAKHEIELGGTTGSQRLDRLLNIGFAVTPIIRGPFEAMSRDNSPTTVVLTGLDTDKTKIIQKALIAAELSNLSKRPSVLIVQKKQTSDNIGSTALVTDDELKKIDDKTTFTDMILSRSTKK